MPYVFLFLLLPLLALLIDTLIAHGRLARLSVVALPPQAIVDRGVAGDAANTNPFRICLAGPLREETSIIVVALQNNETIPVAHPDRPLELVLQIKSRHRFRRLTVENWGEKVRGWGSSRSDDATPVVAQHGPDDELTVAMSDDRPSRIAIQMPYLRPLKTCTFQVAVESGVQEVIVALNVPKETPFRKSLRLVNEHTFDFKDLGYFSTHFVLRDTPLRIETKKSWSGAVVNILLPLFALGGLSYATFAGRFLIPLRNSYLSVPLQEALPWAMSPSSLWIEAAAFCVGFFLIFLLTRDEPSPIGDGYTERYAVRPVGPVGPVKPVEASPSENKSESSSCRETVTEQEQKEAQK